MILYALPHWNHYLAVQEKQSNNFTLIVWPKGNKFILVASTATIKKTDITIPGVKVPKKFEKHNVNELWREFLDRKGKRISKRVSRRSR